jgi:hypothetical protein
VKRFIFFLVTVATMAALVAIIAAARVTRMDNPPHLTSPKSPMGTATGDGFPRPMKQATSTA